MDDTAETTENQKEEDLNAVRNFAFRTVRSESATSNRVKRHAAMLGNDDVEVTIIGDSYPVCISTVLTKSKWLVLNTDSDNDNDKEDKGNHKDIRLLRLYAYGFTLASK